MFSVTKFTLIVFIFILSVSNLLAISKIYQLNIYIIDTLSAPPVLIIDNEKPRYAFTDEEIYLLALLLCGDKNVDGDGEYDFDFKKEVNYMEVNKVLKVVMNRVKDDRFPNSVIDVIFQKNQFAVIPYVLDKEPSDKALEIVKEWGKAYNQYAPLVESVPETHLYFSGNGITNRTRERYR